MSKTRRRVPEVSFSRTQLAYLEKRFPRLIHRPGTPLDRIMFDNGIQEVIQDVRENTSGISYGEILDA